MHSPAEAEGKTAKSQSVWPLADSRCEQGILRALPLHQRPRWTLV